MPETAKAYKRNYYLAYLTANETDYSVDYLNFLNMVKFHPGVNKIHVYVAISVVREGRKKSMRAFSLIRELIDKCEWLELHQVISKSNVGRDFSSAQSCLKAIAINANDQDEILIRNRSAYGPFEVDWFKRYSEIFNSNGKIGLVGNTINQAGHPKVEYQKHENLAHVQTYLYLSNISRLKCLLTDYPGADETDRLQLIKKGEIGLSQKIIAKGYLISCLNWPGVLVGGALTLPEALPIDDTKSEVLNLPFIHRKSKIRYLSLRFRARWWFLLFRRLKSCPD